MKANFRQSMAGLHTWAGLLPGWLLFAIFLFGTTAFFQHEISRWMRPELRSYAVSPVALDAAGQYLQARAPNAGSWTLSLPSDRGGDALLVSWQSREGSGGQGGEADLDPATGRPLLLRDTRGGWFLYRLHFDLHYMPVMCARYIVCIAALTMLVALLTGVVTHKKIFADFFLVRFRKGQRSWLDAHNVTGVLALPFHLMMTYTGLVTLLFTVMPWAITANYDDDDAYYAAAFPSGPEREASGKLAPVRPISVLVARARSEWGGGEPGYLRILNPGDTAGVAEMWPKMGALGTSSPSLYLGAADGVRLPSGAQAGVARQTQHVMVQLHTGAFARLTLRWLYFFAGAGGAVMIASGLVLWTVKRRARLPDPDRPHFGFRLVERLNIGVVAGAPAGIAAYFLANRLLPVGMEQRADWEINCLFIAWGAVFVWSSARPAKRAWTEVLAACAGLYALVPAVSAASTARGLFPSLHAGDWVFVCFDLSMLAMGGAFAFASWKVVVREPAKSARRKARGRAESAA